MKIYEKEKNKNKNFLLKINQFIKKIDYKKLKVPAISFIGLSLISISPLYFSRGEDLNKLIYSSLGKFDKRLPVIIRELKLYGFNPIFITKNYVRSQFLKEEIMDLDINFQNFSKLSNLRDKALNDGILLRSLGDEVKAKIKYKGKSYPVSIRLKGDWTDHLIGKKWSFRVKTKKNTSLEGMSEFSLQHPKTRNYINEYIFHKLLKYENLPYLRYSFLPLRINGKNLGSYALEEHFDKNLIENSGFREGPIIRLSDKDYRNEYTRMRTIDEALNYVYSDKNNADIKSFNFSKIRDNENLMSQFMIASNLFEMYLDKKLEVPNVFDINMTAKYFAISDLVQAGASNSWYDMRFYFNPITARFIPIGYDAQTPIKIKQRILSKDLNVFNLFNNINFLKKYLEYLEKFSEEEYLENFLTKNNEEINYALTSLNKTYPHIKFLKDEISKNQKFIRKRLSPQEPIGINNFKLFINQREKLELEIYNKSLFPIEIIKIESGPYAFDIDSGNILLAANKFERISPQNIYLQNNSGKIEKEIIMNNDWKIKYKILGSSNIKLFTAKNIVPYIPKSILTKKIISRKPNYDKFNSIKIKHNRKEIIIGNNLNINSPLILPLDYKLIINKGSSVNIEGNGFILVQGNLLIKGTKDNPVKISALNGGKGILVINSEKTSEIENAIFDGLSAPSIEGINISGGLSFYESPVNIKNSLFLNSSAEDALNLFRSKFNLDNLEFQNVDSDAIDLDFSDGKINRSKFKNIGNDAIDLSGSIVSLNKILLNNVGDKAISVGERSVLSAQNIDIKNAFIGVASKDLSNTKFNYLSIEKTKICLAAYQKKSEYGPGFIKIRENKIDCEEDYLLEPESKINAYLPNSKNVYNLIYNNQ